MTHAAKAGDVPAARRRRAEDERREFVRALRACVAGKGYEGRLRLAVRDRPGLYEIWVDPEDGISKGMLRRNVGSSSSPATIDELKAAALQMADLAMLAARRRRAVTAAGGDPRSPPAWAFLGHPVMRGVIAIRTRDPSTYRPLDPERWQEYALKPSVHDMRLGYTGVTLEQGAGTVRIDAATQMARIALPGDYPEAITTSLKGRPIGELLGLPGLEVGSEAGDMPILNGWVKNGKLVVTVDCRLVPLATAPEGIEVDWLREWSDRHYR